ncbi:MAG: glycosyltransferase family 4 protein, partial [Mariniphaga sp.]|nr:glycosyltransferase family 4 protein [Mariniphaga sp.]
AKKYNIPLFVSSGEELITLHKNYSLDELKDFVGYVNGVISVSTKNKNEIIEAGLAKKDSCNIIPNAIDPTLFHKKNKKELRNQFDYDEKYFIVAFVGQFTERKGVMRLSNALNSLNDSSIKVFFIGAGNESPDYQEILYKGTVPHDLLPNYLNCADIFVLPSSNEGCSNAIIEAMACGLPIISSDLPFNYDILNEDNAILVNPYDVTSIANAIKFLKEHVEIRSKMSLNAIKTSSDLTLPKRAQKVMDYIQTQIKQRKNIKPL